MKDLIEYHRNEAAERPAEPLTTEGDRAELESLMDLVRPLSAKSNYPRDSEEIAQNLHCQRLCSAYCTATAAIRSHIRNRLDREASWTLVVFSRKCAVLAQRAKNPALVDTGLLAHAIAGLRHGDIRDTLGALDELWEAGVITGGNPAAAFEIAAGFAGPTMAALFREVAANRSAGGG